MQTRLPQIEDNGPWSDESTSEIMFDFPSEESLCTDSSEILTLEVVEPPKDHLDDALELNRQLHASLQRKQEEISALKEKNAQLKELAMQAEHYATILDVLMPQPVKDSVSHPTSVRCSSTEPSEWHFITSERYWLPSALINSEQQVCSQTNGVKRQLWPTDLDGYSNSSDHEADSGSSIQEPSSKSSTHEPCSKTSDNEVPSRTSNHELCLSGSGHEPHTKGFHHELYSQSSGHNVYSGNSNHKPYSNGANHGPYSKSSNQELLSSHPDSCAGGSSGNRFVGGNQDLNRLRLNQDLLQLHSKQPSGQVQQSLALEINLGPKRFKLDQDLLHLDSKDISSQTEQVNLKTTEESPSNKTNQTSMIQVYGAFHGLKVVMARPSMTTDISECGEEEHVCFKTSIREHSTVKTNVFPHGKTFTSRTPDGNCRFLWVPNQN